MRKINIINITTRRLERKLLPVLVVILSIISSPTQAEERQYKIESAYLYSFFNYITWPGYLSPQDMKDPVICVYGDDPILPYLEYVRNKMSMERNLVIRTVMKKGEISGCHILFLRNPASFQSFDDLPSSVLTVVEPNDPLDRGGMIELAKDGEHITIKVNQYQLEENGLQISSRLLNITK